MQLSKYLMIIAFSMLFFIITGCNESLIAPNSTFSTNGDTTTDDVPADDTSADDTPAGDMPTEDKTTDDTPTEDKPTDDTPTEDKPTDDTPTDDNSNCVKGKKLSIWVDKNNDGLIDDKASSLGDIVSYSGAISAFDNYNYYSVSAHPIHGPTPIGFESNIFFYEQEGTNGLYLNFFHNIDSDDQSQGQADNKVRWIISTKGNSNLDGVILSDDNGELTEMNTPTAGYDKSYDADFHYWYNTDGGVIGPFIGEEFNIRVTVDASGSLNNSTFYSANSTNLVLKDDENRIASFIITFKEVETCTKN